VIAAVQLLDVGLRPRASVAYERVHDVIETPASAAVEASTDPPAVAAAVEATVHALVLAQARIAGLAVEATELDERAAALALAEADVQSARTALEVERAQLRARAETLDRREELVDEAQQSLAEQQRALDERATRLHWRWLVRAWRWRPPRPGDSARVCALFFVPSPTGYRILEHEGVAVTPSARISGLLDERRRYVVTKIAPWPLDERWCAYLQEDHTAAGGEAEDDGDP
jgi:FtsZ-binding cell division protein ZapB